MDKFYTIEIAGLKRDLPICKAGDNLYIGAFVMFSDVELTVKAATALLEKSPDFDVILTAESKGIPLAYEMARQSGKTYLVARKGAKLYMQTPVKVYVKSITTAKMQELYLDKSELDSLKGKKVLIVDDVVSTGESLYALEQLLSHAEGNVVGKAFVLAEGDAAKRDDVIYLQYLPLFFEK
ncbi:MAG TPA: adenine phosphoribosyltransferase [Clostridiales bacterium]|nr:adenine phosphoribosyltransferase [Clostridiales bacterium]